jgi:hypothetical protein
MARITSLNHIERLRRRLLCLLYYTFLSKDWDRGVLLTQNVSRGYRLPRRNRHLRSECEI